jgi:hypothetical protein
MKNNIFKYILPVFVVLIVLLGILYFYSLFKKDDAKSSANINSFKGQTEIFKSKKQAYDAMPNDSAIKVHKENVSVTLSSLFKSDHNSSNADVSTESKDDIGNKNSQKDQRINQPIEVKSKVKVSNVFSSQRKGTASMPKVEQPLAQPSQETQTPSHKKRNSFFSSISDTAGNKSIQRESTSFIKAVIHSQQTVYSGATVKMRITSPCIINGSKIPENTFIYGLASIVSERVTIQVTSISIDDKILPVNFLTYDKDGIQGVYIPGLAVHDATKQSVDQAISEASNRVNVPVIGSVPLNVVRNRNNATTATLTDGYHLTLK